MRKKLWIVLAALVILAGAAFAILYCDHQWQDATCTAPQTCAKCGKTQGEMIPHDYAPADCVHPETCRSCGKTQGEALGHKWKDATCTEPETCEVCGEIRGEALGHKWKDATCTEPETCEVCGETQGEALEHQWTDATCTDPKTCGRCGETEGEKLGHKWKKATCTDPKTCKRCGKTKGEALGHDWKEATCADPETCDRCGQTQGEATGNHNWKEATCTKAKHCATCGKTSGKALGHKWKAATCTTAKKCKTCGETSGSALGHEFGESKDGKKVCNVCHKEVKTKYVAITFDDGPSGEITKTLLKGLDKRGAKATFFICGYRIRSYKTLPQLILDYGHEIGLHTDNHATLTATNAKGIRKELEGMMSLLPEDYEVTLMRPPGGAYNNTVKKVCDDLGLSIIMWSVDPKDWATNSVSTITDRIVSSAKDGSIILMHDLKSSSVQAALDAIDILQAQGYEFVTVSELAEIMGYDLNPGEVYYSLK